MSYAKKKLKCKHFEQCSFGKRYFIPAKEAFVSTKYEQHSIPRLLVVSLDPIPTDYYASAEHRTLDAVRKWEETSPKESYYDWGAKTHWKKTYDMVFILLKEFIHSRNKNEVRHYFAHTNSAKCHDKEGKDQSSDELFANCNEYLSDEILILDPDVIVTQGSLKYFAFMNTFPVNMEWELFNSYTALNKACPILINNHNAIWIKTNHPCRHDNKYNEEDVSCFNRSSELISELWRRSQASR